MSINYPTNLDTLSNPSAGDGLNNPSHSLQHSNANDAIEALEAKVGIDSSAETTSHDYKLSEVTDKAVGKTATQTLTNKTLTSPIINLSSNATGDTYYRASDGTLARLPIGTTGNILDVSAGGLPEWIPNPSASDASTTIKGVTKLSVAPASASNPIAVGDNDPRLNINYKTFVANENLTIGTPVGVCDDVEGYVAKALRKLDLTAGLTNFDPANYNSARISWIGNNKFIVVYYHSSNAYIYAICGEINTTTHSVSFGSVVQVVSIGSIATRSLGITRLENDKALIVWTDGTATTCRACVASVSGTTISLGSIASSGVISSNLQETMIATLSSTLVVIGVYNSTASNRKLIAISISGTTVTFGTPLTNSNINNSFDNLIPVTATSFVHLLKGATSSNIAAATISGTTITMGAYQTLDAVDSSIPLAGAKLQDGIIAIAAYKNTSVYKQNIYICSISGTTITVSTTNIFRTNLSAANQGIKLATRSSTKLLIYCTAENYNSETSGMYEMTLSGTTIVSTVRIGGNLQEVNQMYEALTINSQPDVFSIEPTNLYYAVFSTKNSAVDGAQLFLGIMSSNFIGIAQETKNKGENIKILLRGIDSNQTSLAKGTLYYVKGGTLNSFNNGEDLDAVYYTLKYPHTVKSISSTEVIL